MFKRISYLVLGSVLVSPAVLAEQPQREIVEHKMLMDHGDGHLMDMEGGMIMGQNKDKLPAGCDSISEDAEITVHAGHKYSSKFPGTMFAFDQQEWKVKPCTRLTVNFINEDTIRHQWMMHGLPKFMYDKGMFHMEVTGPAKISGTLILPREDRTYLVHCDMAQHMEKGMKGQLVVGKGSTPFPSIPGLTDQVIPDQYSLAPATPVAAKAVSAPVASVAPAATNQGGSQAATSPLSGSYLFGILLGAFGTPLLIGAYRKRFEGMNQGEVLGYVTDSAQRAMHYAWVWIQTLLNQFGKGK